MKIAKYPQRKCRQPVAGEHQDDACDVRERHPGPCASLNIPASVRQREAWEAANPQWEELMKHDDPFGPVIP